MTSASRARLVALAAARRLAGAVLLLIGASFIIYITIRSAPGDAIDAITPMGTPPEIKAQLMSEFGLDRDPLTGYLAWLGNAAQGDFGESLVVLQGDTVMAETLPAFGKTLALSLGALAACLVLALIGAMLLGGPRSKQQILTVPLYVITAAPSFVIAVVFSMGMNELILNTVVESGGEPPPWYPIPIATESVMPYVFAGFALIAGDGLFMDFMNQIRADLQGLRQAQFISAVKAKGAGTARHIATNMVVPLVSGFAARLPLVLGGVVIVEYIFTIEGAGYLLLEASRERDFPVVVGISVLFTVTVIVTNLVADAVRAVVDPREAAHGG